MSASGKLSKQERWILEHSPSGCWDMKALRELLPASDTRSRAVQSASLSRSVSRLVARGAVECYTRGLWSNHGIYLFKTVNPRCCERPNDSGGLVVEGVGELEESAVSQGGAAVAKHSGFAEQGPRA